MNAHLFQSYTRTEYQHRNGFDGNTQYVVAEASSRSKAAERAMRKVYALNASMSNLHTVELRWLGTVEVAR